MKTVFTHLSIILVAIHFTFCSKEVQPPITLQEAWDCHHSSSWDSKDIVEKLVGKWKREYVECYCCMGHGVYIEEDVEYAFHSDMTLVVHGKGAEPDTSVFELKKIHNSENLFQLKVDPSVPVINGRILICEDRIVFNASYIDICDNYLIRLK